MQIKDLIPWGRDKNDPQSSGDTGDNPVMTLQRDMNRVFDDFLHGFERPFGSTSLFGGSSPSTDVVDHGDSVEVTVELPGLDEADIDVSLSGDMLTVRGEKKTERATAEKGYYLSERSYGSFQRTIPLPAGIDGDSADASFDRGVLKITLPKTEEAQAAAKRIEVKGN
ncbi:Hsp20/alpha crystallin family protein [Notoacmeibacter marinus]|uniref:Hsp20/alpha crystallin family protein n=1 Tax=Notoacmeibacter marinus TaxID=1876515 RepID=UPI000DF3F082|nr:Hsp20/alpha crystallin family protein [Notoacmeibacter marinus]